MRFWRAYNSPIETWTLSSQAWCFPCRRVLRECWRNERQGKVPFPYTSRRLSTISHLLNQFCIIFPPPPLPSLLAFIYNSDICSSGEGVRRRCLSLKWDMSSYLSEYEKWWKYEGEADVNKLTKPSFFIYCCVLPGLLSYVKYLWPFPLLAFLSLNVYIKASNVISIDASEITWKLDGQR